MHGIGRGRNEGEWGVRAKGTDRWQLQEIEVWLEA
jgi:hypothetical protein